MIPVLFDKSATVFTTNGIGRLSDAISCKVIEERNGVFELEMVYPVGGIHYEDIKNCSIIVAKPNQTQDRQAFEVYEITKPIDGKVTVFANHISYRQSFIPVAPFIAHGIAETLQGLSANSLEPNPFTFWTDIVNTESTYNPVVLKSLRRSLGGTEGSILDVFSGSGAVEFEWDNFTTKIWAHRGSDNGIALRYAKNITDIEQTESSENLITGVLPMWTNTDNTVIFYGDIQYTANVADYPYHRTEILDLSGEFTEGAPTLAELNQARQNYIARANVGNLSNNIKVSFVDLSKSPSYFGKNLLEAVNLCDTVHVIYEPLDISYDAKVIKTVWDVLMDRYSSIEVGTVKSTIAKTFTDALGDIKELHVSNNKLISITQTIDYELGEVQTTVARVGGDLRDYKTTVSHRFDGLEFRVGNIEGDIATYFDFTEDGLIIGKVGSETDNIRGRFGNTALDFIDVHKNRLRWLDAFEGLGASQLSIGTADTDNDDNYLKRWRIFTAPEGTDDGAHLRFTRHTE